MKKTIIILMVIMTSSVIKILAQSTVNDIPVGDLPADVKAVLDKYVEILNSATLDACAENVLEVAGGSMINPEGTALRSGKKEYSLKKDFENIKFYKQPVEITRVNKTFTNGDGYGASALKGDVYKIWIAKKDPSQGRPAPVTIVKPQQHPTITKPKVTNIGSF
ncbi:MAG: hypothetical protein JXB49_06980 [Bacteroidales bacterium]|nr:hypothetical protein [Bacteroidales bacterium]